MTKFKGGPGDDLLAGGAGDDVIRGLGGDDTLQGLDGADTLVGGAGADRLDGGAGFDIVSYAHEATGVAVNLTAGTGAVKGGDSDVLNSVEGAIGTNFDDTFVGTSGDDLFIGRGGFDRTDLGGGGGDGDDTLIGGAGTDWLYAGTGSDLIRGGSGDDELGAYFGGTGDTTRGVDSLYGGAGDDHLNFDGSGIGSGGAGDDVVSGGGDGGGQVRTLLGGAGDDVLLNQGGSVTAFGGAGADQLSGHGELRGGKGADTITVVGGKASRPLTSEVFGGGGRDTVMLESAATVDLRLHTAQDTGAGVVTLHGVESVEVKAGAAHLTGNSGDNRLSGHGASGLLVGKGGDDVLVSDGAAQMFGGAGDDKLSDYADRSATMTGGAGADSFHFLPFHVKLLDPADPAKADLIADLHDADTIDLSAYREHAGYDFVLVDHFTGAANEIQLVYDKAADITWLEGTTDKDPDAELLIAIAGKHTDFTNFVL